jgi:hypothetical protein
MDGPELIAAKYWSSLWEWIGDKAFLIVVVALAIEFLAARFARPHREALDHARELQLAELQKEAADSQLKLATLRTPRATLLTNDALDSIADKLTPFKGTKFDTGLSGSSGEQADFLWRLESALAPVILYPNDRQQKNAGWVELSWGFNRIGVGATAIHRGNRPVSGPVAAQNVELHLYPDFRDALLPAATALVSALRDVGIEAQIAAYNTYDSNDDAIHILIGEKQ